MSSISTQSREPSPPRKWTLFGGLIGVALVACFALEVMAASNEKFDGLVGWISIGLVLFNVVSLLARWLLAKNRQRTYLIGRIPLAVALSKLATLATLAMLIVLLLAGAIVGAPYRAVASRALVSGLVWSGVLMLAANGILNMIVVVRHLRGTLTSTSRAP